MDDAHIQSSRVGSPIALPDSNLETSAIPEAGTPIAAPVLTLTQVDPQGTLPGVFETNPLTDINGPLWTIRYELVCYMLAGGAAAVGIWNRAWGIPALFAASVVFSLATQFFSYSGPLDDTIEVMARFGPAFMTGAAFYRYRNMIPLNWRAGLLAMIAFLAIQTPGAMIAGQIATAYAFLWLGFKTIPGRVGRQVRDVEDVSYGLYILHWPIGQVCVALNPDISIWMIFAIMAPSTLALAVMLRRFVEKPALLAKPGIRAWLGRVTGQFGASVVQS